MIERAEPMACGNAVKLVFAAVVLTPLRVLRREDNGFTGPDDAGAKTVAEGPVDDVLIDIDVSNGQTYHYKAYPWNGTAFEDDDALAVSATPSAWYRSGSIDLRDLLRRRIDAGLQQEIARGLLKVKRGQEQIAVLFGPPIYEDTQWPVVSVHVEVDAAGERAVGNLLSGIGQDEAQGWLANDQMRVIAWSQNPDERHALYLSLKRILLANLDLFAMLGIASFDFSFRDQDLVEGQYPAPVYTSDCAIQALLPSQIVVGPNPSTSIINDTAVNVGACRLCMEAS